MPLHLRRSGGACFEKKENVIKTLTAFLMLLILMPAGLDAWWDDIFRPQDHPPGWPHAVPPSGEPGPKVIYDHRVFFAAYRPVTGRELYWTPLILGDYPWRQMPKGHDDLIPGYDSSNPANFALHC